MYLVHQHENGKWQVAWMWLPQFLAIDRELHKHVDQGMTKAFKGEVIPDEPEQQKPILERMHFEVIRLITNTYPMAGLRAYLEATISLEPEKSDDGLQRPNPGS